VARIILTKPKLKGLGSKIEQLFGPQNVCTYGSHMISEPHRDAPACFVAHVGPGEPCWACGNIRRVYDCAICAGEEGGQSLCEQCYDDHQFCIHESAG
jgi:hypothetical protein